MTPLYPYPFHRHLLAAVRLIEAEHEAHATDMLARRGVSTSLARCLVLVTEYTPRDWLVGSTDHEDIVAVAHDWDTSGIPTDELEEWWRAGAFCGLCAADLHAAGLTPEDVSVTPEDLGQTIAHAYCAGDIVTRRAIDLARS